MVLDFFLRAHKHGSLIFICSYFFDAYNILSNGKERPIGTSVAQPSVPGPTSSIALAVVVKRRRDRIIVTVKAHGFCKCCCFVRFVRSPV